MLGTKRMLAGLLFCQHSTLFSKSQLPVLFHERVLMVRDFLSSSAQKFLVNCFLSLASF